MSIDLDWAQLDAELCSRALNSINALLQSTKRPAFLGDIAATSFSFGQVSPEIELIKICDVYQEFLHVDYEEEDLDYLNASKDKIATSPTTSLGGFSSSLNRHLPTPALYSIPQAGVRMNHKGPSSFIAGCPFPVNPPEYFASSQDPDRRSNPSSSVYGYAPGGRRDLSPSAALYDSPSEMSLQIHFRIKYSGNMLISLSTSIKINYPSPSFMCLPLNMRLSGVAFEGVFVVAYEGDRKRLHISILDSDRLEGAQGHTLLKSMTVESEVGQTDKLVLKDVGKVEQFVLDTARKAIADEIAWPNFQSFAWT